MNGSNYIKNKGIRRGKKRKKQIIFDCRTGKSNPEPKVKQISRKLPSLPNSVASPFSSEVTDATFAKSPEENLIQLSKDIPYIWHFYPNYLNDKGDYLDPREKCNNSKLDSCNHFREDDGYHMAEKRHFESLKNTSKILKHEKLKIVVKKVVNMCNEKQHTPKESKHSHSFNKEALVNFRKTARKPKRIKNVLEKPQAEIKKMQHSVVSEFCPKNCEERSSGNNNIKCKPRATSSRKNCGKLSANNYYNAGKIVNNINDPPRHWLRDVKGKQQNKIKKENIQQENQHYHLPFLPNLLLSHQADCFPDVNCKRYSGRRIFSPPQNSHGNITCRQKQIEMMVRSVKAELSRRNRANLETKKKQTRENVIPDLNEMRPNVLKIYPTSNKGMTTFNRCWKQNRQLIRELRNVQSSLKIVKELRKMFKD